MSDPAPFCNVAVATPPGDPQAQKGFERIPPGATLDQITRIVNNNFLKLSPVTNFNSYGLGNWVEQSRVVTRVRVFNPNNQTQYVDVDQVSRLVMKDPTTGATWIWNRTGGQTPPQ